MKKIFALFLSILFCQAAFFAQDIRPTPKPTPTEDNRVVKVSTNLIQLDVSVTDAKGRVVTDLRPEEVEIYENGVKQSITGFSFVSIPQPKPDKEKKEDPLFTPPVTLRPDQVKRTIALVVDDLTLSFESAAHTRRALKKFVDEQMQDGDLVGILRTGAGIGALQQFTTNKRQLYAAIERVKWNPRGLGRFSSFDPIEPTPLEFMRSTCGAGDFCPSPESIQAEKDFRSSVSDFRESIFTAGTLGALKYVVNGMGELPGRKSVIMFSDGLKIFSQTENGSSGGSRVLEFLKNLVAEANTKAVIFYPLDARGLETLGFTAADRVFDPNTTNPGADMANDPTLRSPYALPTLSDRMRERSNELFDSQQGLHYLAEETGGFAYTNQNDLSVGVQKVLEDQSYYLVAYQPDGETFDAETRKFNKIKIKVLRKGLEVRHRSGFFVGEEQKRVVVDLNYPTKIMRALTSPFAMNGVNVKLNALFGHSVKSGYFVHSFLHIDAGDLVFKKLSNGDYQASFDVLAISYGDNGVPVDKNNATGSITVKPEHIDRVRAEGIAYSFIFPVKQPGAYQMRVAIMDRESTEVGSANQFVEVPNLKKSGFALSGIVLENLSKQNWTNPSAAAADQPPDSRFSTAARAFKRGTVLRFGVELLNVKNSVKKNSDLRIQTRVYHDQKLVFQSSEKSLNLSNVNEAGAVAHNDAIEFGENLPLGDYVLQILLIDNSSSKKRNLAAQYVQFEVVAADK